MPTINQKMNMGRATTDLKAIARTLNGYKNEDAMFFLSVGQMWELVRLANIGKIKEAKDAIRNKNKAKVSG